MHEDARDEGPDNRGGVRRWARRLLITVVMVEVAWLVLVNGALRLPLTQSLLNDIRPEKFQLAWETAWSPWPARFFVSGARVSGQSPSQQWHAEADRASGSVALLPLLLRQVRIHGGQAENGVYRQRARLRPDREYEAALPWFPEIEGYDISPAVDRDRREKPAWRVLVRDAEVTGRHALWLNRVQARLSGTARGDVDVVSHGGPMRLDVHDFDLSVERAWADEDEEILRDSQARGTLGLGPFRTREVRGLPVVQFLDLDADIEMVSRSLAFVDLFLLKYPEARVSGSGIVRGRIVVDQGRVMDGTDLAVDADDLEVTQPPFVARGAGDVAIGMADRRELPLRLAFRFADLEILHTDDRSRFITGRGLEVVLEDNGSLLPVDERLGGVSLPVDETPRFAGLDGQAGDYRLHVSIPEARVPDVSAFNRYLPPDSAFSLAAGEATLSADLGFAPADARGTFELLGQALRARVADQEVGIDLAVDGRVVGGRPSERQLDLRGTRVLFDNAWVVGENTQLDDGGWSTRLDLTRALVTLQQPAELDLAGDLAMSDTRPFTALLHNHGGPEWLANQLDIEEIAGKGQFIMRDGVMFFPEVSVGSENFTVDAKGVLRGQAAEGDILLRYRRLHALLEVRGPDRRVVLIRPVEKFSEYEITLPDAP